jgi:hypothetical protein
MDALVRWWISEEEADPSLQTRRAHAADPAALIWSLVPDGGTRKAAIGGILSPSAQN